MITFPFSRADYRGGSNDIRSSFCCLKGTLSQVLQATHPDPGRDLCGPSHAEAVTVCLPSWLQLRHHPSECSPATMLETKLMR